jgi:DNA-binding transcriptional MerR regulator|uniref:MerR family transcriptional regulator n=1 Tax=Desulfobacca acetoxidans TaxID=60893 RepID=A0A7C5EU29_9BACT
MLPEEIPAKPYYTIGEASRITGVRPHVLRYWENQGKILRPVRRRSRHRLYRPADIQLILEIKRLREEERLTLPAMRRQLRSHQDIPRISPPSCLSSEVRQLLLGLKEELEALRELLG